MRKKASYFQLMRIERKEQDDRVCGFLEEELRQCSKEQGVTIADSGNAGSRLENKTQEVGSKKKQARRKKCKLRFKNKAFQKNHIKVGVRKLLRAGMVPASRTWERK